MNTAKLTLFDTVFLADALPAVMVRRADQPVATRPVSLWRQSLAAMDNASSGRAHRAAQVGFAVLTALTAGSVVIAAGTLVRCLGAHDGLHTAVQTLMSR